MRGCILLVSRIQTASGERDGAFGRTCLGARVGVVRELRDRSVDRATSVFIFDYRGVFSERTLRSRVKWVEAMPQ